MSDSHAERRRFKRIAFDARTELRQDGNTWQVQLLDLSLKGLLIQRPEPWQGDPERQFLVDIHLSTETSVRMDVRQTHDDNQHLGFVCLHIGLDSISHLKRFVALNLADATELDRELAALIEI